MKTTGQIKPWEWSRIKRGYFNGLSYSQLAKMYRRSRTQIALHGSRYGWEAQRRSIAVIREAASKAECLRQLDVWTNVADQWMERLDVPKTKAKLTKVRQEIEQSC